MAADPILLRAGQWLGAAGGALAVITVVAFLARWGVRFRLVGITSFTVLLAVSCLAFSVSYRPRISVEGAVVVPIVYDNGGDLVVGAAPDDLPAEAIAPTLEQLALNVRGGGRTSPDGQVRVRLRRLESAADGASRPLVLGERRKDLATGALLSGA
ncbi:MAG: Ycf51 family protein [Cyanobium sp.]